MVAIIQMREESFMILLRNLYVLILLCIKICNLEWIHSDEMFYKKIKKTVETLKKNAVTMMAVAGVLVKIGFTTVVR